MTDNPRTKSGWRNEPLRHSLASKGIKTSRKNGFQLNRQGYLEKRISFNQNKTQESLKELKLENGVLTIIQDDQVVDQLFLADFIQDLMQTSGLNFNKATLELTDETIQIVEDGIVTNELFVKKVIEDLLEVSGINPQTVTIQLTQDSIKLLENTARGTKDLGTIKIK